VRVGLPSENRTLCIHYIKLIVTEKKSQMVKILSDFGNKTREQKSVLIFVYCTVHTHTHTHTHTHNKEVYIMNSGTAVAQWVRCCATNRKVAGSIPAGVSGFFIYIKSFRSHYGSRVDSASNRNKYQEHFLGVKVAGA